MPTPPEIEAIVIETVRLLAADFEIAALAEPDGSSALYALADKYDASITLADDKAMSARNSPSKDVRSLAQAVIERIEA